MSLSFIAAVLLVVPTAAVLAGVALSGRRDRAHARLIAEVLAEFRTQAAARAAGSPKPGPGGGPDGPGGPALPTRQPAPARLARVIPFPGATPPTTGTADGDNGDDRHHAA